MIDKETKSVELGFRPEHMECRPAQHEHQEPQPTRIHAHVKLLEPLGDCTLVHLELGLSEAESSNDTASMVAKTTSRPDMKSGDLVTIQVPDHRLHLFDSGTGQRLTDR